MIKMAMLMVSCEVETYCSNSFTLQKSFMINYVPLAIETHDPLLFPISFFVPSYRATAKRIASRHFSPSSLASPKDHLSYPPVHPSELIAVKARPANLKAIIGRTPPAFELLCQNIAPPYATAI